MTSINVDLDEEADAFRMHPQALSRRWHRALDMLIARGWTVTVADRAERYKRALLVTRVVDGVLQTLLLLFYPTRRIKSGNGLGRLDIKGGVAPIMNRMHERVVEGGLTAAIIVSNAKKIDTLLMAELLYRVEGISIDFFATNPFEHMHAPIYEILPSNPTEVADDDLPTMASNNPIARYLDLAPGTYVRVTHTNYVARSREDLSVITQVSMVRAIDENTMVQTDMQEEDADVEDDDGMFDETVEATTGEAAPGDDEEFRMDEVETFDLVGEAGMGMELADDE